MVVAQPPQQYERPTPTTRLDGWHRFVDAGAPSFDLLPLNAWKKLDEHERQPYDEARIRYRSKPLAQVIPLGVFDAREEAKQWW